MNSRWLPEAALVLGGSATAAFCGLLFVAASGRLLPADSFADFVVLSAALTFAVTAGAPYNVAVSQLSAEASATGRPERVADAVSIATRQLLKFAVPVVILVIVFAAPLARLLRLTAPSALALTAATLLLTLVVGIRRAALRGSQRFVPHTFVLLADGLVRLACGLALIEFLRTPLAAMGGYSAGAIAAFVVLMMLRQKKSGTRGEITLADLHVIAGPAALLVIFLGAFQNVDVLLVKRFMTGTDAGAYGAASSIARTMSVVAIPFETLLVSRVIHARHARSSDFATVRIVVLWILVVAVALAAFAVFPHQILALLFGRRYASAAQLLLPLGAAIAFLFFSYILSQILISFGNASFLVATGAVFAAELIALARFHASPMQMATVVFWSQAALLAALLFLLARMRRKSHEVADGI